MDQATYRRQAKNYVCKHFPNLKGVQPDHIIRHLGESRLHIYTFKKQFTVSGGILSRVVRVHVNDEGRVVKAVSSK